MMEKYEYKIIRSRRRTVGLEIKDGELIVRAPAFMSETDIYSFVSEHSDWIKKALAEYERRKAENEREPKLTNEEIRELAEKALEYIPGRVRYYAPKIGVSYGKITVRNQKTRWGSCSSKGNLNFNCLLMLMPPEVIDSVVVHELCHRKEMNHSERFYREVLRVYPEYDRWKFWLKENGARIMNRMLR